MILIVDRIEEGTAVLEKDGLGHIYVPVSELPEGVKEGTVLRFDGTSYIIDADEEEIRRKCILELQSRIFKKAKKD